MIKQIDLLPMSYMIGNAIRQKTRKWGFVVAACAVLILGVSAYIRMSTTALEVELLPIKEKIGLGPVREMEMAQLAVELKEILGQKAAMESLGTDPFWCGLFGDIAHCTSEDMWLASIDIAKMDTGSDDLEPGQGASIVSITGYAGTNEDILAFYRALKNSAYTREVKLEEARMDSARDGVMYFEVVLSAV
jgi:Tfp pilus assembly protein PilN